MSPETTLTDIIARLRQGRFPNEQAISQGIVLRVLQELGWAIYDATSVRPEFQTGEGRGDCCKRQRRLGRASASPRAVSHPHSSFIPHPSAFPSDRRVYKLDLFECPPTEAAEILRWHLARARAEGRT
jgi:hypothetical protein